MVSWKLQSILMDILERDGNVSAQSRKSLADEFGCRTSDISNYIYRIRNPQYWTKYQDNYWTRNRSSAQVSAQNSRARHLGIDGQIEVQEWKDLCERYQNKCACCGEEGLLVIDHVVPISKGGTNTINNIQPLCSKCNRAKWTDGTDYRQLH